MPKKTRKNNLVADPHRPRIGVDLLGCHTPAKTLLAAIVSHAWEGDHPPFITFYATQEIFRQVQVPEGFQCYVVSEEVTMEEDPLFAVRRKKDSSLAVGIEHLKQYVLDAFITGGNSGALLAKAKISLPSLPGIERPAFLTLIPSKLEPIAVLDVGANVSVKAENLLQFAQMGIAYQKTRGISHPTVGLLNVGEEKKKGTPEVQKAYAILQKLNKDAPIDRPVFLGNVEGRNVFRGNIDVLVTDGFTGNVFLKTSQGIAGFVLEQMHNLGTLEATAGIGSILSALRHRLHYAEYPGAILCGIEGIVMKCHGESPPESFVNSILTASRLVKNSFIQNIKAELSHDNPFFGILGE